MSDKTTYTVSQLELAKTQLKDGESVDDIRATLDRCIGSLKPAQEDLGKCEECDHPLDKDGCLNCAWSLK